MQNVLKFISFFVYKEVDVNMIETFEKYVYNFDMKDETIKAKYNHSYRVMKLSEKYARKLKFSKEDIEIAKIIGLLNDW